MHSEFAALLKLTKTHNLYVPSFARFVSPVDGKAKFRKKFAKDRWDQTWEEKLDQYEGNERKEFYRSVLRPTRSMHVIKLGKTFTIRIKRSYKERQKSLETLILLAEQNGLYQVAALLKSMKGVKRGTDVFWYANGDMPADVMYHHYTEYFAELEEVSGHSIS